MSGNVKKVQLLDQGFLELIDTYTQPADDAIIAGARVTHMEGSKGAEKDDRLIRYLMEHRHTSPFEQAVFKFRMYAPLVTYWHLLRHRTLHVNSQSGRYTPFEENAFYVPEHWRLQSLSNHQGSEGVMDGVDPLGNLQSKQLTESLISHYNISFKMYQQALAFGAAKEMARLFLPAFGVYYMMIVSCDLHNWMHFLGLRMADDAQHEIRVYALAMFGLLREQAPMTMKAFHDLRIAPRKENYTKFYEVFGKSTLTK